MATVFTHPVIALALTPWFRSFSDTKSVYILGILFTVFPDIDVIGFKLGIPYEHLFGHRGITHSLAFAATLSLFFACFMYKRLKKSLKQIWLYLFFCMASHGILDAFTNGGLGIAFFAPFTNERYFFSVTPIEVSALNINYFFNEQAIAVLKSEILWVGLPSLVFFISGYYCFKRRTK